MMSGNPPPPSPANSFKGYSVLEYLRRNKSGIKTILGVLSGVITARYGVDTTKAVLLGVAVRFALDAVDYFLSEQPAS